MTSFRLAGVASAVLTCALARTAAGQAVGYQINRYEPTPAGDSFLVVEYPWYAGTRWLAAGFTFDAAHDLLVAGHRDANGNLVLDPSPISSQLRGHLNLAASLHERLGLSLSLPVVLNETGTQASDIGPSGTVAGDPRLGVRALVYGQPDSRLSISAAAYVWIPVGVEDSLAGDSEVRFMPRVTAGGLVNPQVRWAVNGSFLRRATAKLSSTLPGAGNVIGSEVQASAGISYLALGGKLAVGPEALLAVSVIDLPPPQRRATVELFGSAQYAITDQIQVGLGLGLPVTSSQGSPDFRALFSVSWSPRRGPRLSSFEQVVLLPDEDGHVGGIEVQSGKSTTVLDTAYASSEIRKDNKLRPVQSSAAAVDKRVSALASTLPPRFKFGAV